MSEILHRFPSTPHLLWLGSKSVRADKVMSAEEVQEFLSGPIIVEEKIDGANLGISFGHDGELRFQNRGNWLRGKLAGEWKQLRGWAAKHENLLRSCLPERHVLFGEWCYGTHSVTYDKLPDWFLAFDVYDAIAGKFWSVQRRNALVSNTELATVPEIARGGFTVRQIMSMLQARSAYSAAREGVYLRREAGEWLEARAKVVRADFTQAIGQHWSRKKLSRNRVATQAHQNICRRVV